MLSLAPRYVKHAAAVRGIPCCLASAGAVLSANMGRTRAHAPLQVSCGAAVVVHGHEVDLAAMAAIHRGAVAEEVVKPALPASLAD